MSRRPNWCQHETCDCLLSFQEACCGGKLPEPELHVDQYNTHRFCIKAEQEVFDLQVNRNDLFVLGRLLQHLHSDTFI